MIPSVVGHTHRALEDDGAMPFRHAQAGTVSGFTGFPEGWRSVSGLKRAPLSFCRGELDSFKNLWMWRGYSKFDLFTISILPYTFRPCGNLVIQPLE